MSGGESKLLHFYRELSAIYDVDLVTLTYPSRSEIVRHGPHFVEYRLAKPNDFDRIWMKAVAGGATGELSGLSTALLGRSHNPFARQLDNLMAGADIVVHDFPYSLTHESRPAMRGKVRVYNSHNFESMLFRSTVRGAAREAYEFIDRLELETCRGADLIFATSAEELQGLSLYYALPRDMFEVVTLGYDPADFDPLRQLRVERKLPPPGYALFIGSQHGPNIAAAAEVVLLAERMPDIQYVLAGAVCDQLPSLVPSNVVVLGRVSADEKRQLFRDAGVFVNPMREGAGVNVKMVEAFGAGLPMVATAVGARGIGLGPTHLLIAESLSEMDSAVRAHLNVSGAVAMDRLAESREIAPQLFSWQSLAAKAARAIEGDAGSTRGEVTLSPITLFLNDFPIGSGLAGGQRRMLELIGHVPGDTTKVLLTLTAHTDVTITLRAPSFVEINVPKDQHQRIFEQNFEGRNPMGIADVASALHVADNALYRSWFQRLAARASTIVLEHPYMAPVLEHLPTSVSRPRVVYNAYNVESDLKAEMAYEYRHPNAFDVSQVVRLVETVAVNEADALVAVTAGDAERFRDSFQLTKSPVVIDNGTHIYPLATAKRRDRANRVTELVFIGSAHPPNVSGLEAFLTTTFPLLDACHLTVIGGVAEAVRVPVIGTNVRYVGMVSETDKRLLLQDADIAINPVTIGGGSSLKIGDYFAAGLPVVSTAAGIRGFDVIDDQQVLVAELGRDFATAIERLRDDATLRKRLASAAVAYARERLDWRVLGRRLGEVIESEPHHINSTRPRSLLVVTFRYTEPRNGGAEEFLYQVMRLLAEQHGFVIDVVALDVQRIDNTLGMACEGFERSSEELLFAPFARAVHLYELDHRDPGELFEVAGRLADNAVDEHRLLGDDIAQSLSETALLGGWYSLERTGGASWRWTSSRATIQVVGTVDRLRVRGFSPRRDTVIFRVDGTMVGRHTVDGPFDLTVLTAISGRGRIDLEVSGAQRQQADIRTLGVLVNEIYVYSGEWVSVSISSTAIERLPQLDHEGFLDRAYSLAVERPASVNRDFTFARGLNSRSAVRDIADKAHDYDHVLVHGIQFAFVREACLALASVGKRFALLPHMHLDDLFYHWAPFYDCVKSAAALICPENEQYARFLSRLSASIVQAPGGGIERREFQEVGESDVAMILPEYDLQLTPYYVVVGRKSPAKGYQAIIEAFVQSGLAPRVGLVLIGPDDDGMAVSADGVRYLGPLQRSHLIAAIKASIGLISMSESESFGIVIVEAWACGKPVIASRRCAVFRDLIDDGVDGFMVDGIDDLARRMVELVNDRDLRTQMGDAGRAKAESRYEWSRVADRVAYALDVALEGDSVTSTPSATVPPEPVATMTYLSAQPTD